MKSKRQKISSWSL